MPGQHRAGEVVEASRASFAPIPLSVNLALSKPSRTSVLLPHAGQWTPSGQRCWRTRAKHLASSISAERLTRSGTAIFEGPHAGWPARAVLADYHRGPAGTLPRPPPTTPEPNKSHGDMRAVATFSRHQDLRNLSRYADNPYSLADKIARLVAEE